MIWDSRILLHFNNEIDNTKNNKWQKGINKWRQLYTVLPFSRFSMCSCQQYPFHRFEIVFPEQMKAFLKLGPFAATGFYFILSRRVKLNPISVHTFTTTQLCLDDNGPFMKKEIFPLILSVNDHLTQ